MKLKAYNAIALLHPKEQLEVAEKNREEDNTVLVMKPIVVLATNEEQARVIAGREIPEEHMRYMHRIEVLVRPF